MTRSDDLYAVFTRAAERMRDLPIYNQNLSVELSEFKEIDQGLAGVLITPWFMNLVVLSASKSEADSGSVGAKKLIHLPSGAYEFIQNWDKRLGGYLSCSLFSPMTAFTSQEEVREIAEQVMTEIFREENQALTDRQLALTQARKEMQQRQDEAETPPEKSTAQLSRRGFLTAGLSQRD